MEDQLVPYTATPLIQAQGVLVFAPHPDDEVFGPGGALTLYARSGIPVSVIVLTDGAFGRNGDDRDRWIELRESESKNAATALGIPAPAFWRLPDRGLRYGEALISRIEDAITRSGSDLVFATALTEIHPDHRILGMAAVEAVRRLGRARLAMYEIGVAMPSPSVLLDITSGLQAKEAAMACFASQLAVQRYSEQIGALNRFRTYTLPRDVEAAEAFLLWNPANEATPWPALFESEYRRRERLGLPMEPGAQAPLVSIIICSLDQSALMDTLDSLACLTHQNIEVTVVNAKGGNHTDLGDFCGPFRMRLVNQGGKPLARAGAANLGLDHCLGEFALILDERHLLDPQHVSVLSAELLKHPECPAAYTGIRVVENGRSLTEQNPSWNVMRLWGTNTLAFDSVLFRTNLSNGAPCRFDPAFETLDTWDFLLQLSQFGDFWNVPGYSVSCRQEIESPALSPAHDSAPFMNAHAAVIAKWSARKDGRVVSEAMIKLNAAIEQSAADKAQLSLIAEHEKQGRDSARRQLTALLNSRSWKLTAPLRIGVSWLRDVAARLRESWSRKFGQCDK